jgi:hypothetical protein
VTSVRGMIGLMQERYDLAGRTRRPRDTAPKGEPQEPAVEQPPLEWD